MRRWHRACSVAAKAAIATADEYARQRDSGAVAEYAFAALAMARELGGPRFLARITVSALDVLSVTDEDRRFSELVWTELECPPGSLEWALQRIMQSAAHMRVRH